MSLLKKFNLLGKSILLPIAILPIACLLLRIGQDDILSLMFTKETIKHLSFISAVGNAIFYQIPLLFSIGIAIGLTKKSHGAAALSGAVSYLILTDVANSINGDIDLSVFGGVISGITSAFLYNKYHNIELPKYFSFFGGKKFIPIISGFTTLIIGLIFGIVWTPIQNLVADMANWMIQQGAIGSAIFGFLNRILLVFGLHHILNSVAWFQAGDYNHIVNGVTNIVHGDIPRFFAGDKSAGMFMSGFFPIVMFGLPGSALAMFLSAKPEQRKKVLGLFISLALTSFLTGMIEPIEYLLIFISPILLVIHACLTSIALFVSEMIGYKAGFSFSSGVFDAMLSWGISTKPWMLFVLGPIFFIAYFIIFSIAIKLFNINTPGREKTTTKEQTDITQNIDDTQLAQYYIDALGTKDNIIEVDNCITRLRLKVKDSSIIQKKSLTKLGAMGTVIMDKKSLQVIIGAKVESIATNIKLIIENKQSENTNEKHQTPTVSKEKNTKKVKDLEVLSPINGKIVLLDNVNDISFSSRIIGDGVAITTKSNIITSPIDGKIISFPKEANSFIVKNKMGLEILVNIQTDSLLLNDDTFKALSSNNQEVKIGQPIIEIKNDKKDNTIMVICLNVNKIKKLEVNKKEDDQINQNEVLLSIET